LGPLAGVSLSHCAYCALRHKQPEDNSQKLCDPVCNIQSSERFGIVRTSCASVSFRSYLHTPGPVCLTWVTFQVSYGPWRWVLRSDMLEMEWGCIGDDVPGTHHHHHRHRQCRICAQGVASSSLVFLLFSFHFNLILSLLFLELFLFLFSLGVLSYFVMFTYYFIFVFYTRCTLVSYSHVCLVNTLIHAKRNKTILFRRFMFSET
jgi:hypothetical protein